MSCYFYIVYCLLDLGCGECYVISLYFVRCSVVYLFVSCVACLTVFVNCLVKQFEMCFLCGCYFLLNIMDVFRVGGGGGALLDRPCMVFQRLCVLYL